MDQLPNFLLSLPIANIIVKCAYKDSSDSFNAEARVVSKLFFSGSSNDVLQGGLCLANLLASHPALKPYLCRKPIKVGAINFYSSNAYT